MTEDGDLREQAVRRIRAKQSFTIHLTVYIVVNIALVVVWAMTSRDYFWPIWPMFGWAIGLFFHGYGVYKHMDISESRIQSEMEQIRRRGSA